MTKPKCLNTQVSVSIQPRVQYKFDRDMSPLWQVPNRKQCKPELSKMKKFVIKALHSQEFNRLRQLITEAGQQQKIIQTCHAEL